MTTRFKFPITNINLLSSPPLMLSFALVIQPPPLIISPIFRYFHSHRRNSPTLPWPPPVTLSVWFLWSPTYVGKCFLSVSSLLFFLANASIFFSQHPYLKLSSLIAEGAELFLSVYYVPVLPSTSPQVPNKGFDSVENS